jgi:16S rRNA (cytosine967-C5)-methyltransferase
MIAPARLAAYEVLVATSTGHADLASALASSRDRLRDERDRALVSEIATGVQRWRGPLDHLIREAAGRPLRRLDPEVLEILRLSAYQLLYLTRVPVSAAVDDAVNLTKKIGKRSASGLVNAVLRALSRNRGGLSLPARPEQPDRPEHREPAIEYLSVTLSHPRWLATRWLDRLGFDQAEAWMRFNNVQAPLTLRTNRLRTNVDALRAGLEALGVHAKRGRFAPDALVIDHGDPSPPRDGFAGDFLVQDEASQLVTLLVGPQPGPRLLDTCAAPGGKTTAFAGALSALSNDGLIVACDVRERRMQLLQRTVELMGATRVRLVRADASVALPFSGGFDTVVVDAPCSGLGTLRRDPDIRWRREEADLAPMAATALTMLDHAADQVRPGGRLIYATCSSEPEENEQVADRFLERAISFAPVNARLAHPSLPAEAIDERGHLRTTPAPLGLESFFGAVFERRASA